ncbi:MAG: hypothetical protein GXP15_02740 [Gammaproteobacteria bacterium]|nr:hypothetical protein [Gammaproteobacteria bacterium]
MKKSTKSALLSALVFPGLGHLLLKHYLRGSILIVVALTASTAIVTIVVRQALAIIDQISLGDNPVDVGSVVTMASNSTSDSASVIVNLSAIVLGLCWLFGIIDSYKLGVKQEQS